MDEDIFSGEFPGKLSKISTGDKQDWAYIPNPLPIKWNNSTEVWKLLALAREELARLDGVGYNIPNYNLLLRPLQRREALRSSSLEGTYATPEQLLLFEIDPKEPKSASDPMGSWQEVWNYNRALELGLHLLTERPLSLNLIREIHRELLAGVRGAQKDPGNFRRVQVHIGSDRRFIPPPPNELKPCLYDLEKAIHKEKDVDKLIFCFMAHYQFETIHPFLDGNGRVGRLLLSLMIYEQCNLKKPWLYLSAFFDKYKDEYIKLLFEVSSKGNWEGWIKFCLRGTIEQSRDAIRRFGELLVLRNKYMEILDKSRGNIRLNRIIESLFESPAVTIPQVKEMCDISYPTASTDIERLIDVGILAKSDMVERPKIFFAPHIIDITYSN
ncbi:Fic family protein [Synechococcus sp. PCC 7336]|uniref:Fic family protein n=1 Tax=Synechococcus sp. PCC 7336 TaxID=195250 RepID=UPI00034778BC|nr:Fic family protein [Synechococcus sp. PCC 7336]